MSFFFLCFVSSVRRNFSSFHQALVPVRCFMLHFILYHFFFNFSFRFFVSVVLWFTHRTPLNFFSSRAKLPPPSSQGKMIEKYEKFYGKISVDSGLFLSSQLFFLCCLCFEKFIKFSFQYFYIKLENHRVVVIFCAVLWWKHEIFHKSIKYQLDTESHMLLNIIL